MTIREYHHRLHFVTITSPREVTIMENVIISENSKTSINCIGTKITINYVDGRPSLVQENFNKDITSTERSIQAILNQEVTFEENKEYEHSS
jgi:hypothetical protein